MGVSACLRQVQVEQKQRNHSVQRIANHSNSLLGAGVRISQGLGTIEMSHTNQVI